ncbi:MAG: hypothetical protein IPL52_16695 [Flavobacteriales bacterium]|nr:hypothetical protein [Flavobacteriales bacterium]
MHARRTSVPIALLAASFALAQQPGDLDLSFSGDGMATAHFAPIGVDYAQGVAIQPNGRILVVGSTQQDLPTSIALARFMPDGTLDPDFGNGGQVVTSIGAGPDLVSDAAMAVALQPNGRIVVAGYSFENGSGDRFVVARYLEDGTLDSGFGTNGMQINALLNGGRFTSVAIRDDGYIVAGGVVNEAPSNEMFIAARYTPSGTPDTSFDGDGFAFIDITPDDDAASDIALEPGGSMLITGYCGLGTDMDLALVRLSANGSLDPSLAGDGIVIQQLSTDQDAGYTVLRQPADGKILVGGVTTFMPMVFMVVARYNTDGSLDNTFAGDGIYQSPHPGLNFPGNMVLAPDGRIVIGGTWATNFLVAVVNPDGTADTGFDDDGVVTTSFGTNAYGNDLALDGNGKAVLVGSSGQGATFNDFVVMRYHTGFNVGLDERIVAGMAIQACPNPAGDAVELRYALSQADHVSIALLDAQGRAMYPPVKVAGQAVGEQRVWLPLSDALANGAYTISITGGRGALGSVRLVKE